MARDSEKDFLDLITAPKRIFPSLFCLWTLLFVRELYGIAVPILRPQLELADKMRRAEWKIGLSVLMCFSTVNHNTSSK